MVAANKKITKTGLKAPLLASSNVLNTALGNPATIPAKIMIEIPLPIPRSVICSPNHIKNIVPLTNVTTAVNLNMKPGSKTKFACDSKAIAIPSAWNVAKSTVP